MVCSQTQAGPVDSRRTLALIPDLRIGVCRGVSIDSRSSSRDRQRLDRHSSNLGRLLAALEKQTARIDRLEQKIQRLQNEGDGGRNHPEPGKKAPPPVPGVARVEQQVLKNAQRGNIKHDGHEHHGLDNRGRCGNM